FEAGTSEAELMERAGSAVARAAADWLVTPRGRKLPVLAGKGNNGGDALIAARTLAREHGMAPRVYLASDRGDDPLLAWAREADVPCAIHDRDGGRQPAPSAAEGADGGRWTAATSGVQQGR